MMQKIILLDVETTGIETHDRLCQIAFKVKGEKCSYQGLFKPPIPISIEAMSVTHITNEMVADKPVFIGSTLQRMLREDYKEDVLVAHNAQFDQKFLEKEAIYFKKIICTMKLAHAYDKEGKLSKHNLQYLRYFYNLDVGNVLAHDAMGDVIVLEKLFEFYSQYFTVEEMLEISARPILLKVFPFGKYSKEKFSDVIGRDRNYFMWILNNVSMDENLKYTINHYLS